MNKWFNMFRDIDNKLLAKIRIVTRLHRTDVFNSMLKSLSQFNQKKKCNIINRIKIKYYHNENEIDKKEGSSCESDDSDRAEHESIE